MFQWMFKPDTRFDKFLRAGSGGFFVTILITAAIQHVTATRGVTALVCLAFALLLSVPPIIGVHPKNHSLNAPVLALSMAYAWMALLYLLSWTKLVVRSAGYDAITDVVGTLFFVVAWFLTSTCEMEGSSVTSERVAIVTLCLLLFMSGAAKCVIELRREQLSADYQAARLLLNICNGAIVLSLYGVMRRLFPPPDPVTHVVILLFGCAQIAAHGRDCLSVGNACQPPSTEYVIAVFIAWTLLLGKIAFGAYLSYLYFNARVRGSVGMLSNAKKR